jgi:hypothetical protein
VEQRCEAVDWGGEVTDRGREGVRGVSWGAMPVLGLGANGP